LHGFERSGEFLGALRHLGQRAVALGECCLQKTNKPLGLREGSVRRRQRLASRRQGGERFVTFADGRRNQDL
jgi:hypothetical protein